MAPRVRLPRIKAAESIGESHHKFQTYEVVTIRAARRCTFGRDIYFLGGTAEQLLNEPRIARILTTIEFPPLNGADMFADDALKEGKTRLL